MIRTVFYIAAIGLASCAAPEVQQTRQVVTEIYWSDGDSGRIDGMKFRLANVDAPETGGVGARGGAKCEAERALGYDAKEYMVTLTRQKAIEITATHGADRYEREVVELSVDGADLADMAVKAGHLAPWPHKGRKALSPKPDWCAR